jgi:hypothetical protein
MPVVQKLRKGISDNRIINSSSEQLLLRAAREHWPNLQRRAPEQRRKLIFIHGNYLGRLRYFGGAFREVGALKNPGRRNRVSADRAANVRSHRHPIYSDEHVGQYNLPKKAE